MFSKIIPTLKVDIQDDHTNLSVQESLLLQQRYYSLSQLDQANSSLDNKAMALIQAASLIFALIGALQFPDAIHDHTVHVLAAIAASFLIFMAMVFFLTKVWSPGDYALPGTNDWDKMFSDYLWVDGDKCYTQILDNCTEAYARLKCSNKLKARRLTIAVYLFLLQIAGLLVIALIS